MLLREKIETDVFDYLELTNSLSGYANVRGKINRLLSNGEIIRIKKGIYTFPEPLRRHPLAAGPIANMLYGPSYVSGDYALAHYGLIPDMATVITSMTRGRPRNFKTPVGAFQYFQRNAADYSIGVQLQESNSGSYMIASPEKAVYDKALIDRRFTGDGIETYLFEDIRIEPDALSNLNEDILASLRFAACGRMLKLVEFLEGLRK
jgi:hypothetical protein